MRSPINIFLADEFYMNSFLIYCLKGTPFLKFFHISSRFTQSSKHFSLKLHEKRRKKAAEIYWKLEIEKRKILRSTQIKLKTFNGNNFSINLSFAVLDCLLLQMLCKFYVRKSKSHSNNLFFIVL